MAQPKDGTQTVSRASGRGRLADVHDMARGIAGREREEVATLGLERLTVRPAERFERRDDQPRGAVLATPGSWPATLV